MIGSASESEGRVEVYHDGTWGTVCGVGWDISDASVVCRQLGYSSATFALGVAFYGKGSGPIYYNNLSCNGTEARLADCPHPGIGSGNCSHSKDAAVGCYVHMPPGQLNCTEYSDMYR